MAAPPSQAQAVAAVHPAALAVPIVPHQPQAQDIQQHIQSMGPQQAHPNLFQQAVLEHAASVASRPQTLQGAPSNQLTIQHSHLAALQSLSSSDSSTSGGSSSSSGESSTSTTGTNIPPQPTFQSMGPHMNIPFDL